LREKLLSENTQYLTKQAARTGKLSQENSKLLESKKEQYEAADKRTREAKKLKD
jgi:hypothetical protein